MLLSRILPLALGLAALGCDRFDAPAPAASAVASASASQTSADEIHRLARAAADAALACARTCVIHAPNFDDAADACTADAALAKTLTESAAALAARLPDGGGGEGAAFSKVAGLFADWMRHGVELGYTRGTLRLFQDVADAWNRYQPGEPLPVDPVEEFRSYGHGSKGYVMSPVSKTGGRIVWKSCYDGPCLWENHY
jgi:hypothetical protein